MALSLCEVIIAQEDELDIEAGALREIDERAELKSPDMIAARSAALRRIDALKIEGRYQQERERLRQALHSGWTAADFDSGLSQDALRNADRALSNYFDLLRSPDDAQRCRAKRLAAAERIDQRAYYEVAHILEALEPGQKPKGRKRLSPPWRACAGELDQMRHLIAKGDAPAVAARTISASQGAQDPEGRKLAKYYRQRMALRELN